MELKHSYRVRLNLLPSRYRVKRTPNWVRLFFVALLLGFTVLYGFAYALVNFRIDFVQATIASLNLELDYLREQDRYRRDLERRIGEIETRVDILEDLVLGEPDWLLMVDAIGESMPGDLYLEQASFTLERLSFSGSSRSIFSIAQFIDALSRERDFFRSAEFQSLTLQEGLFSFTLTLELRDR